MAKIIELDSRRPHCRTKIDCKRCGHIWIAVYPENTTALECPQCHSFVNENGIPVYKNKCQICGRDYSICPIPENIEKWQTCLSPDCASYDPNRDLDNLIEWED